MLQQLQNLASDDILHGYQTYPAVESFPMLEWMSFAESRVEDCLELNLRYVDYQTLAHLSYSSYVCWIYVPATRAKLVTKVHLIHTFNF